ncbi:MAG: signal peptidase II [Thiohalomonadales bacterium]
MSNLSRIIVILFVILSCAGCDQSTKYLATHNLIKGEVSSFAGDTFRLQYVENTGAFLGMGNSLSEKQRFIIFSVTVSIVLATLFLYTLLSVGLSLFNTISLSLILGGGLSNLYDRFVNNGAVVDFLNIGIGTVRTGIFNIADVFILVGVSMLLLHSRQRKVQNDL